MNGSVIFCTLLVLFAAVSNAHAQFNNYRYGNMGYMGGWPMMGMGGWGGYPGLGGFGMGGFGYGHGAGAGMMGYGNYGGYPMYGNHLGRRW